MATGSAAVPAGIAREASAPNQLKRFFSRYFYFSRALLRAGLAVWAFSDTIDAHLLHAKPPRPLLLWFHGAVFTAWIVLFIVQSALVRMRKVRVHRTLGWLGAALAAIMVVSGFMVSRWRSRGSQSSKNAGVSGINTAGGYGVWASGKTAGALPSLRGIARELDVRQAYVLDHDLVGADSRRRLEGVAGVVRIAGVV